MAKTAGSGIASPCVEVCTVDQKRSICTGCFRTLREIGRWSRMSQSQRQAIMADLPARRARAEAASAGSGGRAAR